MLRRQLGTLFLIICLILTTVPAVLGAENKQVTVSGDGSGDYKCDGKDDHIQINQALDYAAKNPGTKVYLKGPFVYNIKSSCLIGSNTELTGDSSAKLRLTNSAGWTTVGAGTPIIGQIGGKGSAVHDIKIHGFEIDGNEGNQAGSGGKDLYRLISFQGSSNAPVSDISVYNMNLHDAKGEGFRCNIGKNIYYYSNTANNLQHTCVMYSRIKSGEIHDNVARQCACAAIRLDNCQDVIIANEKISPCTSTTTYPKSRTGCAVSDVGIQIDNIVSSPTTSNIIVRNCNIMSGVNGILLNGLNDASNVNIYNNVIYDSGYENEGVSRNGGIGITGCGNGITIQNNDITGSYVAGINVNSAVSGTRTVTVANNNIMNGKTGYAIKNSVASNVNLVLTHNYISGNPSDIYPASLINKNAATSPNSRTSSGVVQAQSETTLASPKPVAAFSASPTSGKAPLSVAFTDKSTNSPTSWKWNFGDGSSSTAKNPKHTYSKTGSYTVVLTATNAAGSNTITKSKYITVVTKPVAAFSASPTSGKAPLTVKFTDKSAGSPTSWSWNFGDKSTSTAKNPSHKYTKAGKYTVTLTIKNAAGSSTSKKTGYIIVK